jgi:uncharacterized membrane protein
MNHTRNRGNLSSLPSFPLLSLMLAAMVASATSGCGSKSNRATLNITIDVDPALSLQTVQAEVTAPGKHGTRMFVPMANIRWTVYLNDLGAKTSVTISAKGIDALERAIVTYTVMATAGPGETLLVPLKLSAACNPGPVCRADENCEDGVCAKRQTIGTGGSGGSAGSGGVDAGIGTGGAMGTGGRVGIGGISGDGAVAGADGGVGTDTASGSGGAGTAGSMGRGGAAGAGGRVGTGGQIGTGGAINTGGATSTGGVTSTGGRVGTGGATGSGGRVGTGGVVGSGGVVGTGGMGTGGTVVCGLGFFGPTCNVFFVGLGYPTVMQSSSFANAISGDGTTVVGSSLGSATQEVAFRWQNGVNQSLGILSGHNFSRAFAVSTTGSTVAGTSYGATSLAFQWTAGLLAPLPLPEFGTFAEAHGMSGDGVTVVGYGDSEDLQSSLRWSNGGVSTVASVDPLFTHTISRDGLVVGGWIGGGADQPMKRVGVVQTTLGLLPNFTSGHVLALSTNGAIAAGYLVGAGGLSRAVRWLGIVAADLGTLGPGFGQALGISGDGAVIVGGSDGNAFIWDGTMRMLSTVLAQAGVNLTNWQLNSATAISTNGKAIAGDGRHGSLSESWIVRLP